MRIKPIKIGRVFVTREDPQKNGTCQACPHDSTDSTVLKIDIRSVINQGWITRLCDDHLRDLIKEAQDQGFTL